LIVTEQAPKREFGKRRPVAAPPEPLKRSNHVALLMMGTLAVGGTAYTLMPRQSCEPASPAMAALAQPQGDAACSDRRSSGGGGHGGGGGGGGSSRSSDDYPGRTSSEARSGVTRGGFGSFARAFGFGGG
jgi:hypothetical protein